MPIIFSLDKYKQRLQNPNKRTLNIEIKESLTDKDITDILGKDAGKNIIKYSELSNYKTLKELLPKRKSYKIILIEDSFNSGHWVTLTRLNNTITYFNSYGGFPSDELKYISNSNNINLKQNTRYLNILLEQGLKDNFHIVFNKKKFQQLTPGVNTCGKHVLLFIIMNQKLNLSLCDYIKFINNLASQHNLSFDQLVSLIIDK